MNAILKHLLEPTFRRLGSMAGGFVVGVGAATETADAATYAVIALCGVAIDLMTSYVSKKWGKS